MAIIGLAFAAQETDNILAAAHDERLDMVLTERGVIEFRSEIICGFWFSATSWAAADARSIAERLPNLVKRWKLDFVVINGENAAGGFGITEAIFEEFIDAGADVVTLGNHAFKQREAMVFIDRAPALVRPAEFSAQCAGPRREPRQPRRTARAFSS